MADVFGPESYETGTVGAAVTEADVAHSSVGTGWTFANDPAPAVGLGTQFARIDAPAATTSYMQASFVASATAFARMYVRFPTVPTTGTVDIATARAGTSLRARLGISGGKYVLRNGSTVVWTSTANVEPTAWNRLEWRLDNTTGQQQLRIFAHTNHHGSVADEDSGVRTFTSGAAVDTLRVGPANNALTTAWVAFYDSVIVSDTTWPGPGYEPGNDGSVTVGAGADQLAVEPWSTVTLTAAETGTGIVGRQWRQTSGPAVALSGATTATATFQAPATIAGVALRFDYEATYGGGVARDSTAVTVRAVSERAVIGGVEVPMRVVDVAAGALGAWIPAAAWEGGTLWGQD